MYIFAYLDAKHYVTGIADVYILKDWEREGKVNSIIINPSFEGCAFKIAQFADCICNYQIVVKMVVGWLSNSTEWEPPQLPTPQSPRTSFHENILPHLDWALVNCFRDLMSIVFLLIKMKYRHINVFWTVSNQCNSLSLTISIDTFIMDNQPSWTIIIIFSVVVKTPEFAVFFVSCSNFWMSHHHGSRDHDWFLKAATK